MITESSWQYNAIQKCSTIRYTLGVSIISTQDLLWTKCLPWSVSVEIFGTKMFSINATSQLANLASLYSYISTISAFFGTKYFPYPFIYFLHLTISTLTQVFLYMQQNIKLRHPFQWIIQCVPLTGKLSSIHKYFHEHKHLFKTSLSTTATSHLPSKTFRHQP